MVPQSLNFAANVNSPVVINPEILRTAIPFQTYPAGRQLDLPDRAATLHVCRPRPTPVALDRYSRYMGDQMGSQTWISHMFELRRTKYNEHDLMSHLT